MGKEKEQKQIKEILPNQGLWTIESLANYLELPPETVQQKLSDFGIKVLSFSTRFKHKLVRLEDLSKMG
jgi:DeoR/GlpR family transcriptional regulator of sugar metabolism